MIERLSGKRRFGDWAYVVRGGVFALEVVVYLDRFGVRRISAAMLHVKVGERTTEYEDGVEGDCELVGGACEAEGVLLPVLDAWDAHARRQGPDWEQPEAFWKALERVVEEHWRERTGGD